VKIRVDRDLCGLHGQCVLTAPAVFSFDDAGELVYLDEVGAGDEERVQLAASICPTGAIEVET